jgi:dihydropteroate synthase
VNRNASPPLSVGNQLIGAALAEEEPVLNERRILRCADTMFDLSSRTLIMGIVNVTPDSFSDGGRFATKDSAVAHALRLIDEGADMIDVGGESSRPGSDPVSEGEELQRTIPVIEALAKKTIVPISIDTYRSEVARQALEAGAQLVNDISAMTYDANMSQVISEHRVPVILMHMKGMPKTMQENPSYADVVSEVADYLALRAEAAKKMSIEQLILDPGIGFGKSLHHNLTLIKNLSRLCALGFPVMVGPSRKSFLGSILDLPVSERSEGTASAVAACILNGADIIRVHEVKEMKRVAQVADAIARAS